MVHPSNPYDCFSIDRYGNVDVSSDTRDVLGFYHCEECGLRILDSEYKESIAIFGQALCQYCIENYVLENYKDTEEMI